jgi:uncharacterized secreted protein with C-terminal beta-propeller domain
MILNLNLLNKTFTGRKHCDEEDALQDIGNLNETDKNPKIYMLTENPAFYMCRNTQNQHLQIFLNGKRRLTVISTDLLSIGYLLSRSQR